MEISTMTSDRMFAAAIMFGSLTCSAPAQQVEPCARCGWVPPQTRVNVTVRTVNELHRAVARAKPGTTILLEDGVYRLDGAQLEIPVTGLVLRGIKGKQARVLLRGRGTDDRIVAISITAAKVTLADLTISHVGLHGIQVHGESGAFGVVIHHVHILDTGQQLIKGSTAQGSKPCRDGLVACSTLEYTESGPSDYTNGVDVLNGEHWVVRDNVLRRIRGPRAQGYRAGPAILLWGGSRDTVVERNWLVDCYRGIALGLVQTQENAPDHLDHQGGIIRRNAVCNLNSWADEAIEVNASPGALVAHNTVLVEGKVPWSIGIRFPTASAQVWNNLSNHSVLLRDGAKAELKANVVTARRDWFVESSLGDLRLAKGDSPAIDAGIVIGDDRLSTDRRLLFVGSAPDVGAFEYRGPR
jgi:hypothetical protein